MKRVLRVRPLAVALLLFGPVACGRSCGCVEGEKTYETLDAKVKVELVRKVRWSGGRIPGPITSFYLRVHTMPVIEHAIRCDHVDMAEDDAGKLVAWRCKGGKPGEKETRWSVLRLRGQDRYIVECDAPVGDEKKPDFKAIEPLSRAASRIIGCIDTDYAWRTQATAAWAELARSIEEDEGEDAAAAFLVTAAEVPHHGVHEDPWDLTLATRSSTVRERALRGVCAALARADAPMPLYVRAAEHCPFDAPGVGAAAVAQLRAALLRPIRRRPGYLGADAGAGVETNDTLADSHARALVWSAVLAAARSPADAGAAVCAIAAEIPVVTDSTVDRPTPRAVAAAVLASTKTKCQAAQKWLDPPPCSPALDCDGGLCSASELAVDLDRWASQGLEGSDGGAPRGSIPPPSQDRALLSFAYAQGPLDREIVVRNARRTYAWPAVDAATPRCDDENAANGTPCRCHDTTYGTWTFCAIEAGTTRTSRETCSFHIDDANKRIDDVRRKCEAPGAPCSGRGSCCDGLECRRPDDGSGLFCSPRRVRDADAGE